MEDRSKQGDGFAHARAGSAQQPNHLGTLPFPRKNQGFQAAAAVRCAGDIQYADLRNRAGEISVCLYVMEDVWVL